MYVYIFYSRALTTHNAEADSENKHVAEVEGGLEGAVHLGLEHKVVDRVEIDVHRDGGTGQEAGPLPTIVLCGQRDRDREAEIKRRR